MKKATKRKIILSGILFNMILVFTACGLCNKAKFIGDEISDTDFYDIAFEQMNSTHSHNIDMDAGESIKVKIISKSGKNCLHDKQTYPFSSCWHNLLELYVTIIGCHGRKMAKRFVWKAI